jgi:hypothetical protein
MAGPGRLRSATSRGSSLTLAVPDMGRADWIGNGRYEAPAVTSMSITVY